MAMIFQLNRRNGQSTPYFLIGHPGGARHATTYLMSDYSYPCSPHCRGTTVAPWLGSAAAVAPMISLASQFAEDRAEFAEPHVQLYAHEKVQWSRLYNEITRYNPDDPLNLVPRAALRHLHGLAIGRHDFWAGLPPLAPAPPRPNPGPPSAGMPPA